MKRLAIQLFRDDAGVVVTPEIIIIATVGLLSLIAGWNAVSNALASELGDIANSVSALDQSYSYRGIVAGAHARCSGGGFADSRQTFNVQPVDVNVVGNGTNREVRINISDVELTRPTQSVEAYEEVAIFDVERIDADGEEVAVFDVERVDSDGNVVNNIQNLTDDADRNTAIQSKASCDAELKSLLLEIQKLCKRAEELKARNGKK